MTSRLRAAAGTAERDLTVAADGTVAIAGESYRLESIGRGAWRVTCGGRSSAVHVARDDEGYWLHVDGQVYWVEIRPAGERSRRKASAREHVLAAPMPATVLSVLVEVGRPVKAGDAVLMLEAMKMELPVRAPHDGIVSAIHCREGELVQPGVSLVDIT